MIAINTFKTINYFISLKGGTGGRTQLGDTLETSQKAVFATPMTSIQLFVSMVAEWAILR